MKHWLSLLCTLILSQPVAAETFTSKVIAVIDGDTVLIHRGNGVQKVRLAEIDAPEVAHAGGHDSQPGPAPESGQAFGDSSRHSLSELVLDKQVKFVTDAVDPYGRLVAHLSVDRLDVNAEQVRRGMAWDYSHYHGNKTLVALQAEARQAARGLWAQRDPMSPWEWRKQHPATDPHAAVPAAHDCKRHCAQMTSCEEARRYLALCGGSTLDGDGDGVPCEKLCGGTKQ